MLKKVLLSTDVTLVSIQHALSTEKEEIMGLLIGEVYMRIIQEHFFQLNIISIFIITSSL